MKRFGSSTLFRIYCDSFHLLRRNIFDLNAKLIFINASNTTRYFKTINCNPFPYMCCRDAKLAYSYTKEIYEVRITYREKNFVFSKEEFSS